ncbi:MAG: UbiD family decarboxylase [Segniliparus sp.]|uniref:UbiD family decarboxylase n=1 Tax=Segniliparus sp. TaxID=2804064 RepID=UPI003F3655F9
MTNGLPDMGGHGERSAGPRDIGGGGQGTWGAYRWSSRGEANALVSSLRAAAERSGPRALAAADELGKVLSAPIRVAVKGREGVGKSKVVQVLAPPLEGELAFVECDLEQSQEPPEIVLHVLAAAARSADKDASKAVDNTMACGLLNKCDTISTPGDSGLWDQAGEAAARSTRELGYPVFPAVALLANASVDAVTYGWLQAIADAEETMPPSAELFLEAGRGSPVGTAERERLLREIGIYGLYCAFGALHVEAYRDPEVLTDLLRELSGFGAFIPSLQGLAVKARARRISEFLAKLEQAAALGVLRDEIETMLAGAPVARLRMDAALGSGVLGQDELGDGAGPSADPRAALDRAVRFRELGTRSSDPRAAGLAWDLHVGFLRSWAERSRPGHPA